MPASTPYRALKLGFDDSMPLIKKYMDPTRKVIPNPSVSYHPRSLLASTLKAVVKKRAPIMATYLDWTYLSAIL